MVKDAFINIKICYNIFFLMHVNFHFYIFLVDLLLKWHKEIIKECLHAGSRCQVVIVGFAVKAIID